MIVSEAVTYVRPSIFKNYAQFFYIRHFNSLKFKIVLKFFPVLKSVFFFFPQSTLYAYLPFLYKLFDFFL